MLTTTVTRIATALLLAAVSTATHAQTIQRIEIIEYGIYSAEKIGSTNAPGTAAGTVSRLRNLSLVTATRTIQAQVGVTFGYRYRVVGPQNDVAVKLNGVNLIPQPGIRNPKTGNTMLREEAPISVRTGRIAHDGYTFNELWEIVRGTWTFELWDGDQKLSTQTFNVQ
jgi:hypothetical protein